MWALIFLYFMGLNIHQATGQDRSTQMLYAKLTMERSAFDNITHLLTSFNITSLLKVDALNVTTTCDNVTDSANKECTCKTGYKWSDRVCQSDEKCCDPSTTCSFSQNSAHMCISENTVILNGTFNLKGATYSGCLETNDREKFNKCNNRLVEELKKVYSTLRGFDILKIIKYSFGSIIVDFEVIFVSRVDTEDLLAKSKSLSESLQASLELTTSGVVNLEMPENPVLYSSIQELNCTTAQPLNTVPNWQRKNQDRVQGIYNGTEALIESDAKGSKLTIKNISEVWAGKYTCTYIQESNLTKVLHIDTAELDACLLPRISITTAPQFPDCSESDQFARVIVKCEIKKSNEPYGVTWKQKGITTSIRESGPDNTSETVFYTASTLVSCNSSKEAPQLNCTFLNRCNQSRSASVNINIIHAGDKICKADGDWEATKAGFTAMKQCVNEVGKRRRNCTAGTDPEWEEEESDCVHPRVSSVLESANIVDIGLGTLEENSAIVFFNLNNVTNETDTINSVANVRTSVDVLQVMSEKLPELKNKTIVNNLLSSSSNLLEQSLEKSWTAKSSTGNVTVAETFLSSIEHLIEVTTFEDKVKEKKTNIEVDACNRTKCRNQVFNATVELSRNSDKGAVKTAGFRQLENYLPHNDSKNEINSIVVSTTVENKESVTNILIAFELKRKRPRNVKIECVAWDNNTRQWSTKGCKWLGGGNCSCKHLSSFAVLMSKEPLTVRGLEEVTLVGLSVSVMSLFLCLAIQVIVWKAVVKSDNLYILHIVQVNISICLLIGDCCFLASNKPPISSVWCQTVVVLKHFSYLAMFFWMLCLSCTLVHQTVFMLHRVSKKTYLQFSFFLGYLCPCLIVVITFLSNSAGAEGVYYHEDICWLVYVEPFHGSIHAFIVPVGIIVFINVFAMLVVIMKLLAHTKKREMFNEKEKAAAKTVIRTVVVLTPTFGVTWIFGFGVLLFDLTDGTLAYAVNYIFTVLNAFQGFFILLTTCLADRATREALLSHFRKPANTVSISDTTTRDDSIVKK